MGTDSNPTRGFIQKWASGDKEMQKQAVYAIDSYIRKELKEGGIVRSCLLPEIPISPTQLVPQLDPTKMVYLIEIEPDSAGATWTNFRGMPEAQIVKGARAEAHFGMIQGKEHISNIYELQTNNIDLRKILNDFDIKEIQYQEDKSFIDRWSTIVTANPGEQDKVLSGGLTRRNWVAARQMFPIKKPVKHALMNTRTSQELLKWDIDKDIGTGPAAATQYETGQISNVHGIKIVTTIKDDLVPDNVVWFFAPEDFMGKFMVHTPPTTFVEQSKQWLKFQTHEVVSIAIVNTKSAVRYTFNP